MKLLNKRLVSLLLMLAMICGMMPLTVLATDHTHTYTPAVTAPTCTEQGYTTYICACGDSYVADYVEATGHDCACGICTVCGEFLPFEDKTISILGDSISTFSGVSNNASYNSTIGSNAVYYSVGTLGVYQADTWWQQTIDALGMELLVNNSWSGSCVLPTRAGTAGAYIERCLNLHNDTTGEEPDVIVVFLGTNDFSYYQSTLGTADIDYDLLITDNGYATPTTTCEAYAILLDKVTSRYPNAEIYCMGMTARRSPDKVDSYADVGQPTAFNAELKQIIDHFGLTYVDLENCGIDADAEIFDAYMGDGRVHPNKQGMDKITEALIGEMLGGEATLHSVSYILDGVKCDTEIQTVLSGDSYTANLTLLSDYSDLEMTVTMGGRVITTDCCSDGAISIGEVTGDIVVTAKGTLNKAPEQYRWEFDGSALVSTGEDANTLTKQAGSITDGVFTGMRYRLETPILLAHDAQWVVEWKASGDWSGMLLTSTAQSGTTDMNFLFRTYNATGLLAIGEYSGQYNNYGIALADLGLDMTASHVYLLENRIADDGSNMIYLSVDGTEIGAMNHYYIGGTSNQNKTVDWVSGRDFVFGYIGSTSHPLKNMGLEYLEVVECSHTYENGTCTGCGELIPQPTWEQGTIASANGTNNVTATRFRTVDYYRLSDYSGVGINMGYTMTNFVYDENYTYLGTSSWLGDGVPFTTAALMEKYPTGVYFRVVFRTLDQKNLTEEAVSASGVKFYLSGETVPEPDYGFAYEDVANIGTWQDGAIWDGKLFALGAAGTGAVFDVKTGAKLGGLTLDGKAVLKPHANSVCFGSTYYEAGDQYPLLYVNIYNNYANAEDRMEGTCCVYRVVEKDGVFSTELVQIIQIGFTEDLTLWKSEENDGDVRPYGNFVVDTDQHKLYAFVMRDANKTTRFFSFDIPNPREGSYNESYGCPVVTLEASDIKTQFDTAHYKYLQGCCYSSGMILYMGDFGGDAPLFLMDLEKQAVTDVINLGYAGLRAEPEVICVDPDSGIPYYAAADGILRILELENIHFHTYSNGTCTGCGATNGPVITKQPVNGEAKLGECYCVTVEADGEGLTYQWYGRNAGQKHWFKSSVTDNTYDDKMTSARAGREVYCVITDANGNSVTTDIVKLVCLPFEELAIVTQPTNGEAALGERYCVTVEATGEGLKYQWYFRNAGATRWSRSGVTDNTYDDILTKSRVDREVYCVITDKFGNKVTTDVAKLVRVPMKPEITQQPADAGASFGEEFCVTVEARGEGLKYQWYYRNAGSEKWRKSTVRDNTYDDTMTRARAGRQVYCVITDQYGNSITSQTATLNAVPTVELQLIDTTYDSAAIGERFCVTVNAQGDGLTYTWYFRNSWSSGWSKSTVRDNTYDDVMNRTRANRDVYCVVTDAYGNQMITEVITLTVNNES